MNFNHIFLLALALFVGLTQGYIATGGIGYGTIGGLGYNGLCGTAYGASYGNGYGNGYGTGYGTGCEEGYDCRPGCAPACGLAAVCDTCQCINTVIKPNVIERIPYSCSRRVQSSACRSSYGLHSGGVYGNTAIGDVRGGCSGYLNNGYLY